MYNRLLNIFRFNRIFWWIICFLLISNIVFFITYRESQKNRINELQKLYNARRNLQTLKKDNGQEQFLQAREDINSFLGRLPEKKDFAETASEFFTILNRHQINIGKTAYKPESVDFNGLSKYTTSLNIKGDYNSLKTLLADIQESRTLFYIEDLSIADNLEENIVELKIKIAIYFRWGDP